jgi:hypothetical protein
MDVIYVLLIFGFGLSLIALIAACQGLEGRGHGR